MAGTPQRMTLSEKVAADARGNSLMVPAGERPAEIKHHPMLAPKKAAADIVTIVDEDFSLMTAGSQNPEEVMEDTDFLGIPGEPYINDDLTHQPGWSTIYGVEADGAIGLATVVGGALNTPEGDYSGKLTVTFKMKALNGYANMLINLCGNGIYDVYGLLDTEIIRVNDETENPLEWHEYSVTFDNKLSNNSSFIQFNAMYCPVLLDDIKVTADYTGFLPSPTALEATDFTLEGFTAHWTKVRIADSYLFSAFSRTQSGPEQELIYDFNDGKMAEGWTATPDLSVSADKGSENTGALIVDKDCILESPYFPQKIKAFEVWFRQLSDESYFGMMTVEGFDGNNWVSLGYLPVASMAKDEDGSMLHLDGSVRPSFHDAYYQLRFSFEGWEEEAEYGLAPIVAVDDILVETMPSFERHYVIKDEPTIETEKVLTGLNPDTDYFYEVASVKGDMVKYSVPVLAFGITVPIPTSTSVITESSYTANWERTPKATAYHVRDFSVFEAENAITEYEVLYETFAPAAEYGGTIEEPEMIGNTYDYMYLNDFCDNPGWNGASTIIAEGMVGSGYGAFQGINTPQLTLNNGKGEFNVEVTVYLESYGYGDAVLLTPSSARCEYIGFAAEDGFNTVTLPYYEGSSSESLEFKTQDGSAFYLQEVKVTQDLNAGDKVFSYRQSKLFGNGNSTSCTFEDVDFASEPVHAFDVMAVLTQDYKECTSEYSVPTLVQSGSKVEANVAVSDVLIRIEDGGAVVTAGKEGKADIYALDGTFVSSSALGIGENFIPLSKGVYILNAGGKSHKLMIK